MSDPEHRTESPGILNGQGIDDLIEEAELDCRDRQDVKPQGPGSSGVSNAEASMNGVSIEDIIDSGQGLA